MTGSPENKEANAPATAPVAVTEVGDKSTEVEPKLAAATKRSRDDEDEDEDEDNATEAIAEVRDVNGALVPTKEGELVDGDNKPSAKRRKSENTTTTTTSTNLSVEIESTDKRETTAELEAEANDAVSIPKNINLADLPNEFPDSEDETAVDSAPATEKKVKEEEEVSSQPSTPSAFVSASTTFTGGFGSFVKSGFGAATPKTSIFGGSSNILKDLKTKKEIESSTPGSPSIFKSGGFSSFSGSGFSTPKKDNPWAESQETPKVC